MGAVGVDEDAKRVGTRVPVRVGLGSINATVRDDATPVQAYLNNLRIVTEVLDKAGIPYFCRPTKSTGSSVVVTIEHQDQAIQLLQRRMHKIGYAIVVQQPRKHSNLTMGLNLPTTQTNIRVFEAITSPSRTWVLGEPWSCDVEFWREGANDQLIGAAPDSRASMMPVEEPDVEVPAWQLSHHVPRTDDAPRFRSRAPFARNGLDRVAFPIDAVFTWVDGSDPEWQARKQAAMGAHSDELHRMAANNSRYASRDELRYALRSIVCNTPWIRRIFVVTDDQAPPWLDLKSDSVTIVRHRDIFGDVGKLPTFNSHAIESRLHHIPDLAEHFIYLNDDMFIGRPLTPAKFFHTNGMARYFPSPAAMDPRPAILADMPVTAAGKNNRRIIEDRFGFTITQKMRHTPYPLLRSVMEEIERELPDEVLGTAAHQFRSPKDLSIPSSLAHYWAYLTHRAVPGTVSHMYADVAHVDTPARLSMMLAQRKVDIFCLNDTDSDDPDGTQATMMAEFLPMYFPFRAPFELPDDEIARHSHISATELLRSATEPADAAALALPPLPNQRDTTALTS